MKILVDTNILISALLFPKSKPAKTLIYVSEQHEMVLCDQNLREVREVLQRKAAHVLPDAEVLLNELSYEFAEKLIRDAKDQPILNAAIVADVDVILTGDKDFLCLEMEHPKCMTVADFLTSEGVED